MHRVTQTSGSNHSDSGRRFRCGCCNASGIFASNLKTTAGCRVSRGFTLSAWYRERKKRKVRALVGEGNQAYVDRLLTAISRHPHQASLHIYLRVAQHNAEEWERLAAQASPSGSSQQGASLFEEKVYNQRGKPATKQGQLTQTLESQREEEVLLRYTRIEELWPSILGERCSEQIEREWRLEAEKFVEIFRETRSLFLTTRNETSTYESRRMELFSNKKGSTAFAAFLLKTAANIHASELILRHETQVTIINASQFNNEPMRVLTSSLSGGLQPMLSKGGKAQYLAISADPTRSGGSAARYGLVVTGIQMTIPTGPE
ncbi:hypothetical protein BU15DRAFT_60911 [Melanogaster broomeanus]|nr:hypothetical protein BU15DRAFT_60911 [Melanogaster broomeanus]